MLIIMIILIICNPSVAPNFEIFLKFPNLFGNSWGNSYVQSLVIIPFYFWWRETMLTGEKVSKYLVIGFSISFAELKAPFRKLLKTRFKVHVNYRSIGRNSYAFYVILTSDYCIFTKGLSVHLTLSWRRSLSYRNRSSGLLSWKS